MNRRAQAVIDSLERQGIDVAKIDTRFVEGISRVQLRFDRVALRFIDDVRSALHAVVPDGMTLMFTITAPIRLASKTAATLEEKARGALARRSVRVALNETINGNQVRVRLVKGASKETRVVGFVHNPGSDPDILFDVTQGLLKRVA